MNPFITVTGPAAPLPLDDVDTDQIIPSAWLRDLHANLAEGLLAYMRRRPDGTRVEEFVLEQPAFRSAPVLIVGRNFGCGSSREHAVWALQAFGIRCVIGHRLAEFFSGNCLKNGVLALDLDEARLSTLMQAAQASQGGEPFTVDLQRGEILGPAGLRMTFSVPEHQRTTLLEGLDEIGLTLRHLDLIEAWERRVQGPAGA